jgi:hypothetical protein
MRLWLSGELQNDIALSYTDCARHLRRILRPIVSAAHYGKSVYEWAFIGIVQQRDTALVREGWQFFKPRGLAEFRLRINHKAFKEADELDRSRLIYVALLRSATIAPLLQMDSFDAELFAHDLIDVGVTHGLI